MKIRLAVLDKDFNYLSRLSNVFGVKYADKLQIYAFTDVEAAMQAVINDRIDILLAADQFEIDFKQLPQRCGFAYMVESQDVESINDKVAICKYQRADLIFRQILSIYSENAGNVSGIKYGDDNCKLMAFAPVSGGVGASSMAAAAAMRFAAMGKKVLYLNLEKLGASDVFFQGAGQFDMSDLIFAIKSKKTNLSMKLESCVKQADNGVYFYAPTKIALDMMELGTEDIIKLITELQIAGIYDYIILDLDFSIDRAWLTVYKKLHALIWVGDGSDLSNTKLVRAFNALSVIDQNSDVRIIDRVSLIYNKFSNKTSKALVDIGIKNVGGAPRFEHATCEQVVQQLSKMEMLDKLI